MKSPLILLIAAFAVMTTQAALAADIDAGKRMAKTCAACHGADGLSTAPNIPNLAGQKPAYISNQLKAFRESKRKNPLMNAIASQLNDADIENLAAFWNSLPGVSGQGKSPVPASFAKSPLQFPDNYKKSFTYYTTIDFPKRKQTRKYYANALALKAAGQGKPLPQGSIFFVEAYAAKVDGNKQPVKGSDGFFEPAKLIFYTAMEMQPGWGKEFPPLLRNGDWNYAVFLPDKTHRKGVNQAVCLACHKPLIKDSYVFSLNQVKVKALKMR